MDYSELKSIKIELASHINGMSFMPLPEILKKIDFDKLGVRPEELPYSFYEVFYHIYFAQKDIIKFIIDEQYENPDWPDKYWPKERKPKDEQTWEALKKEYAEDCARVKTLLCSKKYNLLEPVKNATASEQNLLREVLLILTHTAYHSGQLLLIVRLLNLKEA